MTEMRAIKIRIIKMSMFIDEFDSITTKYYFSMKTLTTVFIGVSLNSSRKWKIDAYLKVLFLHILELPYQRIELDYKKKMIEWNIDQKEWDLPVYYHK